MTCPTFYHVANAITVQGWATDSVPCNHLQPCHCWTPRDWNCFTFGQQCCLFRINWSVYFECEVHIVCSISLSVMLCLGGAVSHAFAFYIYGCIFNFTQNHCHGLQFPSLHAPLILLCSVLHRRHWSETHSVSWYISFQGLPTTWCQHFWFHLDEIHFLSSSFV